MLGQSVSGLVKRNPFTTFALNPANSLTKAEIVDSVVQIGADSASIIANAQSALNLSF